MPLFKSFDHYIAAVQTFRKIMKNYPQVISVMENTFAGDDITVIVDSKRFNLDHFHIPASYEGYHVYKVDIYLEINNLQNFIDGQVLNEPELWEPDNNLDILNNIFNYYKKIIREYEHDLEQC